MNKNKQKIGIALGSGGASGFAHIGVLKVLEENNFQVSSIVGCSIGAIIGACYALDSNIKEEKKVLFSLTKKDLIKLADLNFQKKGLIYGKNIRNFIKSLIGDKTFSDTKIPLKILATDLESGKEVVIDKGKLVDAIMASISIPGIFPPVRLNGKLLVDGGLINPTPTDIVKKMGADIIIGVDLTMKNKMKLKNPNIFQTLMRSYEIVRTQSTKYHINREDNNLLIIKPNINELMFFNFYKSQKFIKEGERVARKALPDIKSLLKRGKRKHK
ncbi:patatin-like phospholipase family protein [Candidatus Pacearchaeota archaeon]|nr:patatin-like phospholipase family protein [Candidatus Pacearchaeota archaeon]